MARRCLLLAGALWANHAGAEESCVKKRLTYYDDSTPPADVGYSDSPEACQAACAKNAGCDAWTYLDDSLVCWQLPMTSELILVGNEHGTSGLKNCAPVAPMPAPVPAATLVTSPPIVSRKGAVRPSCSFRGKAYNDPGVKTLNGGTLASASDCQASCNAQPTCQYWTFYNNTGGCWLQGSNVTEFISENATSGPKLCSKAQPSSAYEAGQNITLSDQLVMMRSIPRPRCSNRGKAYHDPSILKPNGAYVADANVCQSSCAALPSCARFTYYIDSKACWLLTSNVTAFESNMAISGPKACAKPQVVEPAGPTARSTLDSGEESKGCSRHGISFVGHTVATMGFVQDVLACQTHCQKSDSCHVFTYHPSSMSCSLHGALAAKVLSAAAVSGPKACVDQELLGLAEEEQAALAKKWLRRPTALSGLVMVLLALLTCLALGSVARLVQASTWTVRGRLGQAHEQDVSRPLTDEASEFPLVRAQSGEGGEGP